MASIAIVLRTDKVRKNGEAPLYVRLTNNRKSKYKTLGIHLDPKHWNAEKESVRKSHRNSTRLNKKIADEKAKIQSLALDVEDGRKSITGQRISNALDGRCSASVLSACEDYIATKNSQKEYGSAKSYASRLKQLRKYLRAVLEKDELTYGEVTVEFVDSYKSYMKQELGNKTNTVSSKLKLLSVVMNDAQKKKVIKVEHNPFVDYALPSEDGNKKIPTISEMEAIEGLELEEGSKAYHVRNLYVFARYMAGLRFGDVITLRWMNVDGSRLRWETRKTDKQRAVYIPEEAHDILDLYRPLDAKPLDFVFPFLVGFEKVDEREMHDQIDIWNSRCNHHLSTIAKLAELSRVYSFHTSRHFFASEAVRNDINPVSLQHILTHSSLAQTMVYVHINNGQIDTAMQEVERKRKEAKAKRAKGKMKVA